MEVSTMRIALIDTENNILRRDFAQLHPETHIVLFVSPRVTGTDALLSQLGIFPEVSIQYVYSSIKNSMDVKILEYIWQYALSHTEESIHFQIISDDHDFNSEITKLRNAGISVERCEILKSEEDDEIPHEFSYTVITSAPAEIDIPQPMTSSKFNKKKRKECAKVLQERYGLNDEQAAAICRSMMPDLANQVIERRIRDQQGFYNRLTSRLASSMSKADIDRLYKSIAC